jgi:magnesium transporter
LGKFKRNVATLEEFLQSPSETQLSAFDISKILKDIKKKDEELFAAYIKKIPNDILGDVILELPDYYIRDILDGLSQEEVVDVVNELESDDAAELIQEIEEIDEQKAKDILDALDSEDAEDIKRISKYEDEQAGAYMQTELFSASLDEQIQVAVDRLREDKEQGYIENVHQVFVVGRHNRLICAIALEDLILLSFKKTFRDVIDQFPDKYVPKYVHDDEDIDEVARMFEEYDLNVVPVVDYHGRLIGRITSDDILDVMQESATEQIYNLAGVDDEAELEEGLFQAGKTRAIWLLINLGTAILASLVIGLFDETIQSYVALAILMPIVASMGGNAGTQSLTVVVRQLALGEIELNNAKEAIFKEVVLSLANGAIFALIVGIVAYLWFSNHLIGIVIALSMLINLFSAGFFGAVIPLLLKRFDIDPAVGSTVLLTTVTDIVGFFSFLGLAKVMIIG